MFLATWATAGKDLPAVRLRDRVIATQPGAKTIDCLDLATGRLLWQIDSGSDIRYSEAADRLVTATGIHRGQDGSSTISSKAFDPMHANVPCKPLFIVGRNLLWGTDNIKTYGESLAQILWFIGVRPLADSLGRVDVGGGRGRGAGVRARSGTDCPGRVGIGLQGANGRCSRFARHRWNQHVPRPRHAHPGV